MIETIIIDDEKNARLNTLNMINTYCSNIQVVDTADSVESGIDKIKKHRPNLVLLDIDMPDGTGFELLEQLMPINFCVVFITAYAEHEVTAIKFNALGFLVKPLDPEALLLAINKSVICRQDEHYNKRIENLLSGLKTDTPPKIALSNADVIRFVLPEEIIRIEADANYSHFYLNCGNKVTISKPLKEYASMLEEYSFFRTHQSHLVNITYIKEFVRKDGGYLNLTTGEKVAVSHRKKDKLLLVLKSLSKQ